MPEDIQTKKSNEYFIAIANQGFRRNYHSFIMLGVVINGKPVLLRRVAKQFRAIDRRSVEEVRGILFSKTNADFNDEGITRNEEFSDTIDYSAYTISYEQMRQTQDLFETIYEEQLKEREANDKGCCALRISKRPEDNLSNIPLGHFNSGYVRAVDSKTGLDDLFYVDHNCSLNKLSCKGRFLATKPSEYDRKTVLSTAQVLLFKRNDKYHIGYLHWQGVYQEIEVDSSEQQQVLASISQEKLPCDITDEKAIRAINQRIKSLSNNFIMNRGRLTEYDQLIMSHNNASQPLSKKSLATIEALTQHRHLSIREWYQQRERDLFKAVVPEHSKEREEDAVTFKYYCNKFQAIDPLMHDHQVPVAENIHTLYQKTQYFKLSNTCRDTAVDVLQAVRQTEAPSYVSKSFLKRLPLTTTLSGPNQTPNNYFYILPLPPKRPATTHKEKFLCRLYQQMQKMILIAPESEKTQTKFHLLKNLYNEKATKNTETPAEFMQSIRDWHAAHLNDIKGLRRSAAYSHFSMIIEFFDKLFNKVSATEKLFNDFMQQKP